MHVKLTECCSGVAQQNSWARREAESLKIWHENENACLDNFMHLRDHLCSELDLPAYLDYLATMHIFQAARKIEDF